MTRPRCLRHLAAGRAGHRDVKSHHGTLVPGKVFKAFNDIPGLDAHGGADVRDLGRVLVVVLALYGILKFEDFYHRGVLGLVFKPSYERRFFLLEICLSVLIPLGMLLVPKIRESAQGLYLAAVLCLLGFVTNRLNVAITGVESAVGGRYSPKWTEVVITAMFVALGFAIFGFAAKYLPIFPQEHQPEARVHLPALHEPVQGAAHEPDLVVSELAVPVHAGD